MSYLNDDNEISDTSKVVIFVIVLAIAIWYGFATTYTKIDNTKACDKGLVNQQCMDLNSHIKVGEGKFALFCWGPYEIYTRSDRKDETTQVCQ